MQRLFDRSDNGFKSVRRHSPVGGTQASKARKSPCRLTRRAARRAQAKRVEASRTAPARRIVRAATAGARSSREPARLRARRPGLPAHRREQRRGGGEAAAPAVDRAPPQPRSGTRVVRPGGIGRDPRRRRTRGEASRGAHPSAVRHTCGRGPVFACTGPTSREAAHANSSATTGPTNPSPKSAPCSIRAHLYPPKPRRAASRRQGPINANLRTPHRPPSREHNSAKECEVRTTPPALRPQPWDASPG